MYKVYFKQAVELLKQNKFISAISIMATALAIMMVMVIVVVDHIKNADIIPEPNRSRVVYIKAMSAYNKDKNWMNNSGLHADVVKDLKTDLKSPQIITATNTGMSRSDQMHIISDTKKIGSFVDCRVTDANYWKIFSFKFIEGTSLSAADIESGIKSAVISKSISNELFGKDSAIGKTVSINKVNYRVVGVVDNVSKAFTNAYAQIWIPYTTISQYVDVQYLMIMQIDDNDIEELERECREYEKKWNLANEGWELKLKGPYNHREIQFNTFSDDQFETEKRRTANRTIFLFAVMLIIPAINLSGISLSRVRRRMEEIGIRKAFGAKKITILMQILYENFITSLLGGVLGGILSCIAVYVLKEWLLSSVDDSYIPIETFLSFPLLIAVIFISFILNLLSSGVPAYLAAKMQIVDSINLKK